MQELLMFHLMLISNLYLTQMKKIIYIKKIIVSIAIIPLLISCSDWLDVSSDTNILEKDIFKKGAGFRQALNGIYTKMGQAPLYGRELTWGFSSVMSDLYYKYDITSHMDLKSLYKDFLDGEIESDYARERVYDPIWANAYSVIANCNNLLSNAEKADVSIFQFAQWEKDIIIGEAKAVRALMHFEILRLFGYSKTEEGNQTKRIPYVNDFYTIVPTYYSTQEVLDLIIKDLESAREHLADYDLHIINFFTEERFDDEIEIDEFEGEEIKFMAYRGSRMNYLASTLLLSRAYLFAENYDKADEYAKEIYKYGPKGETPVIEFSKFYTFSSSISKTSKIVEEVLFASFNDDMIDEYALLLGDGESLRIDDPEDYFEDEEVDYRYARLFSKDTDLSIRFTTKGTNENLIPILRLSEAYHIMAECQARKGNLIGALDILDELRFSRKVDVKLTEKLAGASESEILDAIWNDIKRESMDDGRISWLYKRIGKGFSKLDGPLPLPRKETDYMSL